MTCREPGGTALGERLREALFAGDNPHPLAELMIFGAARAQLVHEVIRPALHRGALVLCDRYADSTIAYQHFGRDIDLGLVTTVAYAATTGIWPDLTVLLDLEPTEGLQRGDGPSDYIEHANEAFHGRVRDGYELLVRQEPERWLVLDGTRPAEELTEGIWSRVTSVLDGENA